MDIDIIFYHAIIIKLMAIILMISIGLFLSILFTTCHYLTITVPTIFLKE